MKKTKKTPLPWYNPVGKDVRTAALEREDLVSLAAGREGRALLESYCRIYRVKL